MSLPFQSSSMTRVSRKSRWIAALSYVAIGILWYVLDENAPKTKFVRFHINQAIVFLITVVLLQVFSALFMFIPFIWFICGLIVIVIGIIGVVNAFQARKKRLPLIGDFVEHLEL